MNGEETTLSELWREINQLKERIDNLANAIQANAKKRENAIWHEINRLNNRIEDIANATNDVWRQLKQQR